MKKSIGLLAFAAVFFTAVSAQAAFTSIKVLSFTATASVAAVSNFVAQTDLISNNLISGAGTSFAFGAQTNAGGRFAGTPNEYLAISVTDNAPLWKLQIYSDNYATPPSTSTYGFQYGGLKGGATTYGDKVSLAWLASTMTVVGGPALGISPTVVGSTSAWTYMKDLKDIDGPGLVNASWAEAQAAGYANIAFGGGSIGTSVVTTLPTPIGQGVMRSLTNPNDQFEVYLRGDFALAAADSYTGTIKVELYHP